jgi:hypothetical protein
VQKNLMFGFIFLYLLANAKNIKKLIGIINTFLQPERQNRNIY